MTYVNKLDIAAMTYLIQALKKLNVLPSQLNFDEEITNILLEKGP